MSIGFERYINKVIVIVIITVDTMHKENGKALGDQT